MGTFEERTPEQADNHAKKIFFIEMQSRAQPNKIKKKRFIESERECHYLSYSPTPERLLKGNTISKVCKHKKKEGDIKSRRPYE